MSITIIPGTPLIRVMDAYNSGGKSTIKDTAMDPANPANTEKINPPVRIQKRPYRVL